MKVFLTIAFFLLAIKLYAQLSVEILPIKVGTQKAIVPLKFKNDLPNNVEAARAVCFLLDKNGKLIAQATHWVIGQKMPKLDSQKEAVFNFVVSAPSPFSTTNLTAKVSFTRLILATNVVGDVKKDVVIRSSQE